MPDFDLDSHFLNPDRSNLEAMRKLGYAFVDAIIDSVLDTQNQPFVKDTSTFDIVQKLEAVLENLNREGTTGNLEDPDIYIFANIKLQFSEIEGVLYFGGKFENKLIGMVGSLGSLIGNHDISSYMKSNLLFPDHFLKRVLDGNIKLIEDTPNERYKQVIQKSNSVSLLPSQKFEFLAKTHFTSNDVFFGTPIYVASSPLKDI